jgi:hypothetical protein
MIFTNSGYHSEEQVRFDYKAFEGLLYPDGIILLHDTARDKRSGQSPLLQSDALPARFEGLQCLQFAPHTDLALEGNGAWRWNTDKREMHDYFASRRKDW